VEIVIYITLLQYCSVQVWKDPKLELVFLPHLIAYERFTTNPKFFKELRFRYEEAEIQVRKKINHDQYANSFVQGERVFGESFQSKCIITC
jgi:hypothetical protein